MQLNTPRTYRATLEAWLGQLFLPLAFFTAAAVTGVNRAWINPWLAGLGLSILFVAAIFNYLVPMFRNYLHLDARSIEGSLNGHAFMLYWTEILATWMVTRRQMKFLCLGTRDGTIVVPMRFFDDQAVWERVQKSVPFDALDPNAIQRLPDFQELARAGEAAARRALEEADDPTAEARIVVDHWLFQGAGWAGMGFFLFCAISAAREGQYTPVAVFLALALLAALILVNWGTTEFTTQGVRRQTLFRTWEITWDEVRSIEIDPNDCALALVGDSCQVVLPGPRLWSGSGCKAALALLLAQAERRRIPVTRTITVMFRTSRRSQKR